jgi:predicted transcriptional regulator
MDIQLTPEQEAAIASLAAEFGQDPQTYAQRALEQRMSEDSDFVEAIRIGREQLDRGDFLTHEEVGKRMESWFERK